MSQLLKKRNQGVIDLRHDCGAKLDKTTDDTAAMLKAIDLQAVTGEAIYLSGIARVTQPLAVTQDAFYIVGDGPRRSGLWVDHDGGSAITVQHATTPGAGFVNGFGLEGVSLRARRETTGGALLDLNKVQLVTLDRVFLEDHFAGISVRGGLQHYYSDLHILSARASAPVSWTGAKAGSFFVKIGRSADGQVPSELFVDGFNFRRNEAVNYIEHGIVINSVDGLWLSNGHVMGVSSDDIRVEPVTGVEQITGIKMANVWNDNNCQVGLRVVGNTTAAFGEIEMDGVRFLTPSNIGIFVEADAVAFEGVRMHGGALRKAGAHGVLLRAGKSHQFNGVDFGACNTGGGANIGAITVDGGADKVQAVGCCFDKAALGVSAAAMVGVRVNSAASSQVTVVGCSFDLDAEDVSDASTSDANSYKANTTTKAAAVASVSGTSLQLPEIGDVFNVAAGLNFNNATGRWNDRVVVLRFAGASTVTHGVGGIRLAGAANFAAKAGDVLTLCYEAAATDWVEVSRMVS